MISFSSNFVDFYCFEFSQTIEVKKILSLLAFLPCFRLIVLRRERTPRRPSFIAANYLLFRGLALCLPESCAACTTNRFLSLCSQCDCKRCTITVPTLWSQPTVNANFLQYLHFQELFVIFTTQANIVRLLSLPIAPCALPVQTCDYKGVSITFSSRTKLLSMKNGFCSQLKREVEFFVLAGFGEKRFERGKARNEHSYGH